MAGTPDRSGPACNIATVATCDPPAALSHQLHRAGGNRVHRRGDLRKRDGIATDGGDNGCFRHVADPRQRPAARNRSSDYAAAIAGCASLHRADVGGRRVGDDGEARRRLVVAYTLAPRRADPGARNIAARAVRLLETSRIDVPAVIGVIRPVIVVPIGALTGLSAQHIEAILAHELAHIRRHDYLVNLLQAAVEALMFYHPAVWWMSKQIRLERENCCDDIAAAACGDRCVYASALAELEERRGPSLAMAASGDGDLLTRVRRLLMLAPPYPPKRFRARSLAAAIIVLTC